MFLPEPNQGKHNTCKNKPSSNRHDVLPAHVTTSKPTVEARKGTMLHIVGSGNVFVIVMNQVNDERPACEEGLAQSCLNKAGQQAPPALCW